MRATNKVLNGSSVVSSILLGSHNAISRSNLYATCSAFSRLLRSNLSSFVSTLVGGGVSFGSYKKKFKYFITKIQTFFKNFNLPQIDLKMLQLQNNLLFSSREEAYRRAVGMESDLLVQIKQANLQAKTASFLNIFISFHSATRSYLSSLIT